MGRSADIMHRPSPGRSGTDRLRCRMLVERLLIGRVVARQAQQLNGENP
jgi:hypothetical protein